MSITSLRKYIKTQFLCLLLKLQNWKSGMNSPTKYFQPGCCRCSSNEYPLKVGIGFQGIRSTDIRSELTRTWLFVSFSFHVDFIKINVKIKTFLNCLYGNTNCSNNLDMRYKIFRTATFSITWRLCDDYDFLFFQNAQ